MTARLVAASLDSHTVGIAALAMALRRMGIEVLPCPAPASVDEIAALARAEHADGVLVAGQTELGESEIAALAAAARRDAGRPWYFRGYLPRGKARILRPVFRRVRTRTMGVREAAQLVAGDFRDEEGPATRPFLPEIQFAVAPPAGAAPAGRRATGGDASTACAGPWQLRRFDAPTVAEVAQAARGGADSVEGGVAHALCGSRHGVPQALARWKAVDAACARLGLEREACGVLTGILIPPSLGIAVGSLEALAAAQQGVQRLALSIGEQGCRTQDVAAVRAARRVLAALLERSGHQGAAIRIAFHEYPAALPRDRSAALALTAASAATAAAAGADTFLFRPWRDAGRAASAREANDAAAAARRGLAIPCGIIPGAAAEEERIVRESFEIIDGILGLARDPRKALGLAFRQGMLDIPHGPDGRSSLATLRDAAGAVRYLDAGALPLSARSREDNARLLAGRLRTAARDEAFIHDVTFVKDLRGASSWPLARDIER